MKRLVASYGMCQTRLNGLGTTITTDVGKYQKDWARRERVRLTAVLGGECAACGTTERLEFDCIKPCGDKHHRMDTSSRMCFYRKQHAKKNLQLLCQLHNNRKSIVDRKAEKFRKWAGTLTRRRA